MKRTDEEERWFQALRHHDVPDRLIAALGNAELGEIVDIDGPLKPRACTLTSAETRALQAAAFGLTVAMISETYGLAHTTVQDQIKSARRQLGAKNTTHAVALALRQHLIH